MKAIVLLALCAGIFYAPVRAQQSDTAKTGKREQKLMLEVRAVLDAQVEAWNRGDIEGFMRGYAQSTETLFVSGDTVTRGWQTVLDRYKKGYDSREKMGTLTFSELEIKPFGKDAAIVIGRWRLKRAADEPKGRFTLIFRRTREGWRIIHDHTS
jgi:uncharacterized protein (TIGR02246 family)